MIIAILKSAQNKLLKILREPKLYRYLVFIILAFLLINALLGFIYSDGTYPNTKVGNKILGSVSHSNIDNKLGKLDLLPSTISFSTQTKTVEVSTEKMGISIDNETLTNNVKSSKSWLPIVNLLSPPKQVLELKVDDSSFNKQLAKLLEQFKLNATNAQIVVTKGVFSITQEKPGYQIKQNDLKENILSKIRESEFRVVLLTEPISPTITKSSLTKDLDSLQAQQKLSVTFRFQDKSIKATPQDIASWFNKKGAIFVVSTINIKSYINNVGDKFGIQVQNIDSIVNTTASALNNKKPVDITLKAVPKRVVSYTYCVAAKGVNSSYLGTFSSKIYSTLNDSRGWGVSGQVSYSKVSSGCNFTMWLSAANLLPTFGAICDSAWSCTVSPNVIINLDRWNGATTAWNSAGGGLEDYRSMVINHEVGHWLGFGHRYCSGAGQLAPVMQQQSINLQGCRFNPWPLPSEIASLKAVLGI